MTFSNLKFGDLEARNTNETLKKKTYHVSQDEMEVPGIR